MVFASDQRSLLEPNIFVLRGSVVEPEPPGAALFGRSRRREKGAASAPALQLQLQL